MLFQQLQEILKHEGSQEALRYCKKTKSQTSENKLCKCHKDKSYGVQKQKSDSMAPSITGSWLCTSDEQPLL